MKQFPAAITLALLLSGAILGQQSDVSPKGNQPGFDIADVRIHPRSSNTNIYMTGGVLRNGRYDLRKATMLDLIAAAYSVDPDTVLGGPSWLEWERFDIAARAPAGTSPDTLKLMLQSLLAQRFGLMVRKDTQPIPAYALRPGKGKPRLKTAEGKETPGCRGEPRNSPPGVVLPGIVHCHGMSMEAFARGLREMAGDYLTSPVFDATGLQGEWDFDLTWINRGRLALAGSEAITIFDAVDKQLGLQLDLQKAPAPVLVVESVNQTPTENPAGVAEALPPSPIAEFDVADVKLSLPDTTQTGRLQPGGRLDLQGFTMRQLMNLAWDFPNNNELIADAPKWLDSTKYSILAKSSTATAGAGPNLQVDIDDLRLMLRALLVERFKVAAHMEARPINAYTLLAAKPKLAKADPANRTACREAAAAAKDPRNSNPALARLVTCRNITMDQFAEQIPIVAPGYVRSLVKNETGLDGAYDLTVSFSTIQVAQAGAGRGGDNGQPPAASSSDPSDPNGAVSLFEAISRQLGLRLESRKRPVPVLVIDHIEEKPTEN
jgi:uncharacterized protein (TIGR03435 family)